jgi:hypothetical protein
MSQQLVTIDRAFEPDLAELLPAAADRLKGITPGYPMPLRECPKGPILKAIVKRASDPLFEDTLGKARQEVLETLMRNAGGDYAVEWGYGPSDGAVEVTFDTLPDREKPALRVTSEPRQGTKVKPGDTIRIDIAASDEANRWQTGIKTIQVLDDQRLFDHQDYAHAAYGGPVSKCEPERRGRTWWTTYTVPPDPPPIIRLTVVADDFAGNEASEAGAFPTADWYGQIEFVDRRVPIQAFRKGLIEQRATVDLRLDHDANGKLTGQARGSWTLRTDVTDSTPETCFTREIEDGAADIDAELAGTYAAGVMSITVTDDRSKPLVVQRELIRNCSLGGLSSEKRTDDYGSYLTIVGPILQHGLMPTADGGFGLSYGSPPGPGGSESFRVWVRPTMR